MTYNEICNALAEAEIENNRGEASMLICRFCNINKADLLLRHDENFDSPELADAVATDNQAKIAKIIEENKDMFDQGKEFDF